MWTGDTLPQLFKAIGFDVRMHEYWDLSGTFHRNKVRGGEFHQTRMRPCTQGHAFLIVASA